MNYLAHLYFAQPTADSHFGNLLGDFRRGVDMQALNHAVQQALANHYQIDKFTDQHPAVKASIQLFASKHRRFAPVALDILYDHFLINCWDCYHTNSFEHFTEHSYALLRQRIEQMPPRMQQVVGHMTTHNSLAGYQPIEGVKAAIGHVARRIRFTNDFAHSFNDIEKHYDALHRNFEDFFPELQQFVTDNPVESP